MTDSPTAPLQPTPEQQAAQYAESWRERPDAETHFEEQCNSWLAGYRSRDSECQAKDERIAALQAELKTADEGVAAQNGVVIAQAKQIIAHRKRIAALVAALRLAEQGLHAAEGCIARCVPDTGEQDMPMLASAEAAVIRSKAATRAALSGQPVGPA